MANMTFDDVPGFSVDRNAYRDENDPTTIEEYNIYDNMTHSLDVRRTPALRDPALVDLTAAKAQAHRDRIDADERAAECKRGRLREIYGEHGIGILAPHTYTSKNDKVADEQHLGFHALVLDMVDGTRFKVYVEAV